MVRVLIDKDSTFIFKDTDYFYGNYNKTYENVMGQLINTEGIVELIKEMPISKFYVNTRGDEHIKEITKEQAISLYESILKTQQGIKKNSTK